MAYRANLFDFGAVAGMAGGANAAANDAAFLAAMASPVQLIEVEPEHFEIGTTILHNKNGKQFVGIAGQDCFGSSGYGTRLEWWGASGGEMVKLAPASALVGDLIGPGFSGFELNGNGLAGRGLSVLSTRMARADDIHILDMNTSSATIGAYLGSIGVNGDVSGSYAGQFNRLSVNVGGGAHGIMLDGVAGAGNTCFSHFTQPRVVHENGIGYYLRACDDNHFFNAAVSRVPNGTGLAALFDGNDNYCLGNIFHGVHFGVHPVGATSAILSRGSKARLNCMYGLTGVDTPPVISITTGSELYYDYVGGGYGATLATEKALRRMPKRVELTY